MNKEDEKFYERAAQELANRTPVPGIMAKAFADADGDEKKAFARYIALRVEGLRDEFRTQPEDKGAGRTRPLKAWRRTQRGREDWVIHLTQDGIRFINTTTQEDVIVTPRSDEFTIAFRPLALTHRIVLTNRHRDRFSFNAYSHALREAREWWEALCADVHNSTGSRSTGRCVRALTRR